MNQIIHPLTNEKCSIFSAEGKYVLKNYIKQSGGGKNSFVSLTDARGNVYKITIANLSSHNAANNLAKIINNHSDGPFETWSGQYWEQVGKAVAIKNTVIFKLKYNANDFMDENINDVINTIGAADMLDDAAAAASGWDDYHSWNVSVSKHK